MPRDHCVFCTADRHLAFVFFGFACNAFAKLSEYTIYWCQWSLEVHLFEDGYCSDTLWPPTFQLHDFHTLHMLAYYNRCSDVNCAADFGFADFNLKNKKQKQPRFSVRIDLCQHHHFQVPHMWNRVSRPRHGDRWRKRNDRKIRKRRGRGWPWNLHGVQCHCIAGYHADPEVPDSSWQEKTLRQF